MLRRCVLLLGLGLALLGCSQPEIGPTPALDPELGVAPTVTEEDPRPAATPSPAASPTAGASASSAPATQGTPTPDAASVPAASPEPLEASSTSAPTPSPRPDPGTQASTTSEPLVLLAVADATGDHGARGPAWADLTSVEFVELENDLRVTLRFAGPLPATPPDGEVPLVGVDIGEGDRGYQLFVEGGGQSWAAYLDTPEGFVAYPGTFELAGRAIVLQVPFSAIGSPTRAPVRAFAEWSRDNGLVGVLNPTSEDKLDDQPHTFDRTS